MRLVDWTRTTVLGGERSHTLLSLLPGALCVFACAGEAFTEEGGGSSAATGGDPGSGGSTADGGGSPSGGNATGGNGTGGGAPAGFSCPVNAPVPNASCQVSGLTCSYGQSPRPDCRPRYQCSGSRWIAVSSGTCSGDSTCPAAQPATGAECVSEGQICAYPSPGVFCGCPPCEGFCTLRWVCSRVPAAPCPALLPNDGTACADNLDGVSCDYGHCDLGEAVSVTCRSGRFTWATDVCP